MNIEYVYGELSEDFVKDIARVVSLSGPKVLYFSCQGGRLGFCKTIIDMINNAEDLEVVGTDCLYSGGFYIYHKITCKKRLADRCKGMWHDGSLSVDLDTKGREVWTEGIMYLKMHKKERKLILGVGKDLKFSKKHMRRLKKGKDVFFSPKQMRKLFNN